MSEQKTVVDLVRLPFKLAEKITGPVTGFIGRHLGPEMDQIVKVVPGLGMIEEMCQGFNAWVEGKTLPPLQKPPLDAVKGGTPEGDR